MKVLIGCVALTLMVGVTASDAAWFGLGKKRCLPKAIDYPIVRKKVKESHKPGNHQKHPADCSLRIAPPVATA